MNRTAVMVLGMHRSGTSALAGLLANLGLRPPRTLIPPSNDNPAGYWESQRIATFHDELLRAAGTDWAAWTRVSADWLASKQAAVFSARLGELFNEEFEQAPLVVLKDPRLCRLLPFWLPLLRKMGVRPKAVLAIRNPIEVARSLGARDGVGEERALLMWLRHTLDAELFTRKLERVVVHYEDLIKDCRSVADRISSELSISWPARVDDAVTFVNPQLKHQEAEAAIHGKWPGMQWIDQTCAALRGLRSNANDSTSLRTLDAVLSDFERATQVFAPVVEELDARTAVVEIRRNMHLGAVHHFGLDVGPTSGPRTKSYLYELCGWVIARHPQKRMTVRIYQDGIVIGSVPVEDPRPDVAEAFPGFPDAGRSGFRVPKSLQTGSRGAIALKVELIDDSGTVVEEHLADLYTKAFG